MQQFRSNTTVMIAIAVVFGGAAVFLAKTWLERQASMQSQHVEAAPLPSKTLVVAANPLRFGTELKADDLKEIPWHGEALPAGSYEKIDDVLKEGRRVALNAIEPYEAILRGKITGPGEKASLASLVSDGYRAVTLRVNDVNGVAGFVLPGDRVDVIVTRSDATNGGTDVVLQNIRVLAVDQIADSKKETPEVVKAVTVEVTTQNAQKLALASNVGSLSLVLRPAGDTAALATQRVTIADIGRNDDAPQTFAASSETTLPSRTTTVRVMRAAENQEYSVPSERD